jgi:uncharacterized iron-regulated membrane protein
MCWPLQQDVTRDFDHRERVTRRRILKASAELSLVIHFGSIYGLPTKIIALVACLAIPLSAVEGFLIGWWKRPGKSAQAARQLNAASQAKPPAAPISPWIVAGPVVL